MSTLGKTLSTEIARISRRTLSAEIAALRKAVTVQRRTIASLKRSLAELSKAQRRSATVARSLRAEASSENGPSLRFVPKGLVGLRRRAGLSAEDLGRLLGVTGQTVLNWEARKATPRPNVLPRIAAIRSLGKRELQARLETLRTPRKRAGGRAAR